MAPREWKQTVLEECVDILDSKRVPLNQEQRSEMRGDIPYWGANGIVDYINDYIFDEPLVLIAEDGGYFDEAATRPICLKVDGKAWINNHAHVMRAKNNTTRDWIYYYYVHRDITPFIIGGTRAKLNQSELRKLPIALPEVSEQNRITEVLGSVDAAIETTRAVIDQTKKVKQGLLQTLLTQGIGHTKFKDSSLGKIPESWEVKKFGTVCKLQNGFAFKSTDFVDDGIPLIRISSIQDGGVGLEGAAYLPKEFDREYSAFTLKHGDILIAMSGATTGKLGVYELNEPALLNQRVGRFVILDSNKLNREFLKVAVEHIFKDVLVMAYGGAQPNISSKDLENYDIALPPLSEQQQMGEVISSIINQVNAESVKLSQLQKLKSGLMSDLLTGKVRTI